MHEYVPSPLSIVPVSGEQPQSGRVLSEQLNVTFAPVIDVPDVSFRFILSSTVSVFALQVDL